MIIWDNFINLVKQMLSQSEQQHQSDLYYVQIKTLNAPTTLIQPGKYFEALSIFNFTARLTPDRFEDIS